jgi:hypothetical protein
MDACPLRQMAILDHQSVGGFHLDPTDSRVIEQQRLLDKLTDDARRLKELQEVRSATWQAASHVLTAVEGWLRDGVPSGVVLADHEVSAAAIERRLYASSRAVSPDAKGRFRSERCAINEVGAFVSLSLRLISDIT